MMIEVSLQLISQIPHGETEDPHATGDHLHDPDLMPALEDDHGSLLKVTLFTHLISPTIRMKCNRRVSPIRVSHDPHWLRQSRILMTIRCSGPSYDDDDDDPPPKPMIRIKNPTRTHGCPVTT
jgi:hypothetical protein